MKFFVITVCRDGDEFLSQCVDSVLSQTHTDWTMCIVVDDSMSAVGAKTLSVANKLKNKSSRIRVVANRDRLYALRNLVENIDRYCPHDAVVVELDGDDYLADKQVLSVLDKEYSADDQLDVLWTQFRNIGGKVGFCRALPAKANPATHPWVSSHLKTFRKRVLWGVRREVFLDESGKWWKTATDRAFFLPMLSLARKRKFLNRVCCVYRRRKTDNDPALQRKTAKAICHRLAGAFTFTSRNVLFIISGLGCSPDRQLCYNEKRPFLGVLSMSAHLRARGHNVVLVDRMLNPSWFPADETLLEWADVVGLHVATPTRRDGYGLIEDIRAKGFKGRLLSGGPHSVLFPEELLKRGVDYACTYEADYEISRLVEDGDAPNAERRVVNLDSLPFPDYELVQSKSYRYARGWSFDASQPVISLSSSRGCPHICDVGRLYGRDWYAQSPYRMVLDVAYAQRVLGAKAIYFCDSCFDCDRARILFFCRQLGEEGIGVRWACDLYGARVGDKALIQAMAQAGCVGLCVEAGTDRLLISSCESSAVRCHERKYSPSRVLSVADAQEGRCRSGK